MIQSWIIRTDIRPTDAIKTGLDVSVCGACPLRPSIVSADSPRCYVSAAHAPTSVFDAFHRGAYGASPADADTIERFINWQRVRVGSYGNPSAVPVDRWNATLRYSSGWTGYDHRWADLDPVQWAHIVMASVETLAQAASAQSLGWRTFRVSTDAHDRAPLEVSCPASREGGYRSTCIECMLCAGTSAKTPKSVVILDHGAGWKKRLINIAGVA